ncbi:MAG: SDR family NAD(P)-dependent oxidoreductase [Bacteroidales bacterium]|jgi:rhamnose utilization protein RhaD (predicted bifunctional aldolase and dehydrogenase)/NAD(P)-dependent dehydrogenase (short-subunit alcohol dehydrogenase family)|nr:SDR family NAD(P)-dependent oxidoreductase [Bacteroidales bacterium]
MKEIQELIEISRFYGKNSDYVIAGGGNTSFKTDRLLWVKASGTTLGTITEAGFAVLDREKLKHIAGKTYSHHSDLREQEVKTDLFRACTEPEKLLRPSVETSMHDVIRHRFVVHTHPTIVNALLCSQQAESKAKELFGDRAVYIPYTDPGYVLFKKVESALQQYRTSHRSEPHIILLQNHGVFVSADTTGEIRQIYADITEKISSGMPRLAVEPLPVDDKAAAVLPAIRMLLSTGKTAKIVVIRNNTLIADFCKDAQAFAGASAPFTPDIIVYCKARPIYLENTQTAAGAIDEFAGKLEAYRKKYGCDPKIILLKGVGLASVEDNFRSADIAADVFEDLLKISSYSRHFGGPKFLNDREISFIDNWEVENYRRTVSKGQSSGNAAENKIVIVTGGAQGFGGGIAEELMAQNAHVVIADLNETVGAQTVEKLNAAATKNRAVFIRTDVSDALSVQRLMKETVKRFGGLDVLISNAGILRAGSLEEMAPDTFELMTKVNYTGYFLCAKYASEVLKLQAKYKKGYFTDVIQINSKSGLKGSNKNFAYAGGKFGGIGLTQSFALELMPYGIKVNSVCPGNFFDGPLWSDPERGLFVQYLNAGKVPGAKTIADVKAFYEAQVPAKRGCTVADVMKAVLYIIGQEYETGQAVPVTGGQNMLR